MIKFIANFLIFGLTNWMECIQKLALESREVGCYKFLLNVFRISFIRRFPFFSFISKSSVRTLLCKV